MTFTPTSPGRTHTPAYMGSQTTAAGHYAPLAIMQTRCLTACGETYIASDLVRGLNPIRCATCQVIRCQEIRKHLSWYSHGPRYGGRFS